MPGVMKTPIQQLIDRLEEIYQANPMEPEYRAGIGDAILQARLLLPVEAGHIKEAWRSGGENIITQTGSEYYRNIYGEETLFL